MKRIKHNLKYRLYDLPIPVQNHLYFELGKVILSFVIILVLAILNGFDQFCIVLCSASLLWLCSVLHKSYLFLADKVVVVEGVCKNVDRKSHNVLKSFRIYGNSEMELEDGLNTYRVAIEYNTKCREGNTVRIYTMPYSIYELDAHLFKISSNLFIY